MQRRVGETGVATSFIPVRTSTASAVSASNCIVPRIISELCSRLFRSNPLADKRSISFCCCSSYSVLQTVNHVRMLCDVVESLGAHSTGQSIFKQSIFNSTWGTGKYQVLSVETTMYLYNTKYSRRKSFVTRWNLVSRATRSYSGQVMQN